MAGDRQSSCLELSSPRYGDTYTPVSYTHLDVYKRQHIFMLPEQVNEEIKNVAKFCDDVYKMFGFEYHVELSTRPEDSMGTDEEWEMAENALRNAIEEMLSLIHI